MNFYRQHFTLINSLLAVLFVVGLTISAIGNSNGKTGVTESGCSCHGSLSNNTSVSLTSGSGSFIVDPNSTTTFTVGIDNSGKVNAGMNAGVKTSESGGSNAGTLSAGTGTKISGGEVTHNGEQTLSGGKFDFKFDWKSPSEHGEYWVRGVANAVNDNGSESGDEWNRFTTKKVIVAGVTVTAPNGGQNWCLGSSQDITWNSDGIDNVKIEYSKDGGSNWSSITNSTSASAGSFSWSIPNGLTPGNDNLIRVSDADKATRNDVSNNSFTIIGDVEISQQPTNNEVCTGESFSISVIVTGSGHQYQWRKNGTNISGANQPIYTKNNASTNDAGEYDCVVTTSCGNELTSNKANLTVNESISFTSQPSDVSDCEGGSVTLQANVAGEISSLQWRKGGLDLDGENSQSLTINNLSDSDVGNYTLFVTSDKCNSEIESTVATVSLIESPIIVEQPQSKVGCEGGEVRFIVQAGGEIESYQWYKDDVKIDGENERTLTLNNLTPDDVAAYKVEIIAGCGQIFFSEVANLALNTTPEISSQPIGKELLAGEQLVLSVTANNPGGISEDLSYQWQKDGVDIESATEATLDIQSVTLSDAGMYKVNVSNACNFEINSEEVEVKVIENNGGPAITTSASFLNFDAVAIGENKEETFEAVITNSGDETLTIESVEITGDHAGSFTIVSPNLPISIEPDNFTDITIEFEPTIDGNHTAILSFTSNAINNASIELRGIGQDNRTLVSSVSELDFEEVVLNEEVSKMLTLSNNSLKNIVINKVESSSSDITTNISDNTLVEPSGEQVVTVSLTPTEVKNYDELLTFSLDDGNTIEIPVMANVLTTSVSYGIPSLNSAISYPNPSQKNIVIKLDFTQLEKYQIEIVNTNGITMREFEGISNVGTNEVNWNVTDSNNNRVSSGSYYVIVKVGDRLQTIPIVIN